MEKVLLKIPTGSYNIKQISEYLVEKISAYYRKSEKNND